MIRFTEEALAAANREAERKIRHAIGSGTVRPSAAHRFLRWWRRGGFVHDAVIAAIAAAFVAALVAWLWFVTS